MDIKTVNLRMHIALNGEGRAKYDPSEAVVGFLKRKKRRQREPNYDVHKKHIFIFIFSLKS